MNLSCALPNAERAFILKRKNHQNLLKSLSYLQEVSHDIFDEKGRIKFKSILQDLEQNTLPLFPFTLLNEQLTATATNDDLKQFKNLVEQFTLKKDFLQSGFNFLTFGSALLSPSQWDRYRIVMMPELLKDGTMLPPTDSSFNNSCHVTQKALDEIKNISTSYYDETKHLVSNILFVKSDKFIAASSFDILGLVTFIEKLDFNITVEYIVHETAHQYLYNLMVFDVICEGEGRYESPLRKDPRPLEGIYHATFVLARIIDFYNKALKNGTSLPEKLLKEKVNHYRSRYRHGYDLIMEKATLTNLGRDLLISTKDLVL